MKKTNRSTEATQSEGEKKGEQIRGKVMKNTIRSTQATHSESEQKRENSCVEEKCEQHCHSVKK